jgi:hypothetical protein
MTAADEYAEDLFGEVSVRSDGIPRKGSRDYLAYLASLTLPDGLRFWSLAVVPEDAPPHVESIWCTDRRQRLSHLLIDRRTGQRYDPESGGRR